MSRSITLGRYFPGDSLLHRFNPRFKLLILILFLAILFLMKTLIGLGLLLMFLLLTATAVRVPLRYLFNGLRPVLYIILFTAFVYFFFTKGGVVLLRIGPLTIEQAGVWAGSFMIARLLGLVLLSMLLTLTTTPLALARAMEFFMKPLGRVGFPAGEVAMIMMIALRFIPTIAEESQRLLQAQEARGADFGGGFFSRARKFTPLMVPLFVSAFRRADDLALAMEARGYRIGAPRTQMLEESVTIADWAALLLSFIALTAVAVTGL
ncbi:MAG TPA: energy-coupling factor transporter transmembrane protein EcfT [Firmicutes bacterium]|nr:energy-coupling factor transporter transmembrane protein EcfT [Bacillota bacterium]